MKKRFARNEPIRAIPQIDPHDSSRFVCGGKELVLAGYYPGLQPLISGPSAFDGFYRTWLDRMADHQVNLIRHCLTFGMTLDNERWRHPYQRPGPGTVCAPQNAAGWQSGPLVDLDLFDETFFDYWEEVLAYAAERGVVIIATLFDNVHTKAFCQVNAASQTASACSTCNAATGAAIWRPFEVMGLYYDYYYGATNSNGVTFEQPIEWFTKPEVVERQKAYAAHAVERLCRHPNLIWEVANELDTSDPACLVWQQKMGKLICRKDPHGHLIMPFDLPGHQMVAGQKLPSGVTTSNGTACQNYHVKGYCHLQKTNVGAAVSDYVDFWTQLRGDIQKTAQPQISDNDFSVCPGDPQCTALYQRRKAWTALVAGAYVNIFLFDVFGPHSEPTIEEGMRWTGYLRRYLADHGLSLSGSSAITADLTSNPGNEQPVWALACQATQGGKKYIVYFLQGGSANLAPLDLPAQVAGRWFDPQEGRDGEEVTILNGMVTAPQPRLTGKGTSDPCSESDWVLTIPS